MESIIEGALFPHNHFWKAEKGSGHSQGWKNLMMRREAIANKVRWPAGNGDTIKIRVDRWMEIGVIGGPTNHNEPKE